MLSFTKTRILNDSPEEARQQIMKLEFPDESSFSSWLETECNNSIEWIPHLNKNNLKSKGEIPESSMPAKPKRGRPAKIEWSKINICSYNGIPKLVAEEELERVLSKPSRKVGCKANIKAQKMLKDQRIYVTIDKSHTGHGVNTLESWSQSRICPELREWLQKVVASGIDWKSFQKMRRSGEIKFGFPSSVENKNEEPIEISEVMRITNQHFINYRKKHISKSAQLDPDCWRSLQMYSRMIQNEGGISLLDTVSEDEFDGNKAFVFAFCSSWQVGVFQKYNSIVFLDSTHNTCVSLDDRNRKAFLYTIVVKHDFAGCGIPVAFMVTNTETQNPIARWLTWLKECLQLPCNFNIMIDCSATEMAAISSVFGEPQIKLCHWHMLRAMRSQAGSKIIAPLTAGQNANSRTVKELNVQLRKSAIQDFVNLVHTKSKKEFDDTLSRYYEKYQEHKKWLNYIDTTWMKHTDKWWSGKRIGMLGNNTNNYVESWHNSLKSGYLGNSRKHRTDVLVHLLLHDVLPEFQLKVARVSMGLDRRQISHSEKLQQRKSAAMDPQLANSWIRRSVAYQENNQFTEVLCVKSFTTEDLEYEVSLNAASTIKSCTCPFMVSTNSVCKHMFLAERVLGYNICFETRNSQNAGIGELSSFPDREIQAAVDEGIEIIDQHETKILHERLQSCLSCFKNNKVLKSDLEEYSALVEQATVLKRKIEARENSWSKKQRR